MTRKQSETNRDNTPTGNFNDNDHFLFFTVCRSQADIVFLLDGSGSVLSSDFMKMKGFVKKLVSSFQGTDTKVLKSFDLIFMVHLKKVIINTAYLMISLDLWTKTLHPYLKERKVSLHQRAHKKK